MFKNSSPNNCQANKKRIRKKAQEKYQNHSKKKGKKATIWPRALQKSLTSKYLL